MTKCILGKGLVFPLPSPSFWILCIPSSRLAVFKDIRPKSILLLNPLQEKLKIDLCLSEEHVDKMGRQKTQSLCDLAFIIPFSVILIVMPPSHFTFTLSSYKYSREDMQQFLKSRSSSSLSLSISSSTAAREQDNIFFLCF